MKLGQGFDAELEKYRKEFELGDYLSFASALMLCTENQLPLPEWVTTQVFDAVAFAFERQPTDLGRGKNRIATTRAKEISDRRADMAHRHLHARWKDGRRYRSFLGFMYGYGTPDPAEPRIHFVTEDEIFDFVSEELEETFARGSAREIKRAHAEAVRAGRFRETDAEIELVRLNSLDWKP